MIHGKARFRILSTRTPLARAARGWVTCALAVAAAMTTQTVSRPRALASDAPVPRSSSARPIPAAELEGLEYFRGSWICTGVVEPSAAGPAHLTKGRATYKWEVGGFFQGVANQDDHTPEDPLPRIARGYMGYETATKEYTLALFFVGGGRMIAASPDWSADKLKFVGDSTRGGGHAHVEQLITRKSDAEYLSRLDGIGADGKMTALSHEKCLRIGKFFGRSAH